ARRRVARSSPPSAATTSSTWPVCSGWPARPCRLAERRRAGPLVLVPLALLVHHAEEAPTIGGALPRTRALLAGWMGRPVALPSERQLQVALAALTAGVFLLWLAARVRPAGATALLGVEAGVGAEWC